jgi:hypothetical protein
MIISLNMVLLTDQIGGHTWQFGYRNFLSLGTAKIDADIKSLPTTSLEIIAVS